jgi:uncharacterized protein (DUF934 family)
MPRLIDRRGERADPWADRPEALVPLADWAQRAPVLQSDGVRPALLLGPDDDPAAAAPLLGQVAMIAVNFPQFVDGRGYSIARLLRTKVGWTGELRAVGDIRRDQLFFLARCGFDTFALRDDEPVDEAITAFDQFSEVYQAGADRGPLFTRRGR